jgi:hypothetical protein
MDSVTSHRSSGIQRERAEAAVIAAEFPGWEAWVGVDNLWHARQKGTERTPENRVTGEDPEDLRDMIRAWIERQP